MIHTQVMRVGIIDSGVHATHPHVQGVAGGVGLQFGEPDDADYTDRLGHGTAVAAVIRHHAPDAALFAVKILHSNLKTNAGTLVRAIDWCIDNEMQLVNVSLGTPNSENREILASAVARATARGVKIVSARGWFPGDIAGVIPVDLDWNHPWGECYERDGVYYALGYPRPIPGVPVERNLSGISFAVAHVTGRFARGGL